MKFTLFARNFMQFFEKSSREILRIQIDIIPSGERRQLEYNVFLNRDHGPKVLNYFLENNLHKNSALASLTSCVGVTCHVKRIFCPRIATFSQF